MRILILGGGGREHALAWKLAQSAGVSVFSTPGNPGMARVGQIVPVPGGTPEDFLAAAEAVDAELTVVGPEAPLVAGVVDLFRARGRKIVGPDRRAAQLEGSKIFAKNFLVQSKIPTAAFVIVDNGADARAALDRFGFPVVLKADGLAAGKGVIVARDRAEAEAGLETLASLKCRLVIEEFLEGREVSFIALCDGRDALPLEATQDHKAVFDGDAGPNTGGMGAYCDGAILTEAESREVLDRVILPTVDATKFTGFLYAGLMMTRKDGPKVLEFNVRLGDPETQPLMHRMQCDFVPALAAAAEGRLGATKLTWRAGASVCVVMASGGYPGAYSTGKAIGGIEEAGAAGAASPRHASRRAGDRDRRGPRAGGHGRRAGPGIGHRARLRRGTPHSFQGMHYRAAIGRKGLERYNGVSKA